MKKINLLLASILVLGLIITGCSSSTNKDYSELLKDVKLGDYTSLPISVTKEKVTDDDIEEEMNDYINEFVTHNQIKEGVIKDGDIVNIDYTGKIDGVAFDGGTNTNYELTIGSGTFIDGFEESLIGSNVGDTVEVKVTFPETYQSSEVAGKEATFEVKINYICDETKPILTDEFVAENTDYKTVDELRTNITDFLNMQAETSYTTNLQNAIIDYLIENSEFPDIPDSYTKDYIENMKNYYMSDAIDEDMEFNEYLESTYGLTEDDFETVSKEAGVNFIKSKLILLTIAKNESITLSDEEFDEYLDKYINEYYYDTKEELLRELESHDELQEMKEEALFNKVFTFLYENIE